MVVQRSMHPAIHGRESLTTRCVRLADANFEDQYIGPMMRIIGNTLGPVRERASWKASGR